MSASTNAALGIAFLILSVLATGLMYQYWGYPYDKVARKSSCPQWKMNLHRAVGAAYGVGIGNRVIIARRAHGTAGQVHPVP